MIIPGNIQSGPLHLITPLVKAFIQPALPLIHPFTRTLNYSVPGHNVQVTVLTTSSYAHLKVDEDGLHVLWTQDLLQRDHVILQNT